MLHRMDDSLLEVAEYVADLNLTQLAQQTHAQLRRVLHNQETLMATVQELTDAATALTGAVDGLAAREATETQATADLQAQVAALQAQVAAGVDPATLQPILDAIVAATNRLTAA